MSVIFSRQCEYALQAVTFLALKENGQMTSIKELTGKLGIPYHFLGKILQDLTYKGLLVSQKGPTGGFRLGMPAHDITLLQIVEAIDGPGFRSNCVLGFQECSESNPCAAHEKWRDIKEKIHAMLASRNVAEMAKDMRKPEYGFHLP